MKPIYEFENYERRTPMTFHNVTKVIEVVLLFVLTSLVWANVLFKRDEIKATKDFIKTSESFEAQLNVYYIQLKEINDNLLYYEQFQKRRK